MLEQFEIDDTKFNSLCGNILIAAGILGSCLVALILYKQPFRLFSLSMGCSLILALALLLFIAA